MECRRSMRIGERIMIISQFEFFFILCAIAQHTLYYSVIRHM